MPIFKRRKSNQEYVSSMNFIKSQHATKNNYSFLPNSKKKTNYHQRRYHKGSPEVDCAKLTWHLSLIRELIFLDKGNAESFYGLFTLCSMCMDFWYRAISVKIKKDGKGTKYVDGRDNSGLHWRKAIRSEGYWWSSWRMSLWSKFLHF